MLVLEQVEEQNELMVTLEITLLEAVTEHLEEAIATSVPVEKSAHDIVLSFLMISLENAISIE